MPVEMTTKDYIFCEDCQEYVDLWKYSCIEDTNHEDCNWRYVTEEELAICVEDCTQMGCFKWGVPVFSIDSQSD